MPRGSRTTYGRDDARLDHRDHLAVQAYVTGRTGDPPTEPHGSKGDSLGELNSTAFGRDAWRRMGRIRLIPCAQNGITWALNGNNVTQP